MKVDAGQSSISMLNDVMEIQKYSKIKDQNGKLITDPVEKAKSLTSYYVSLFSCEHINPQIQSTESGKPFTISINITRNYQQSEERNLSGKLVLLGKF